MTKNKNSSHGFGLYISTSGINKSGEVFVFGLKQKWENESIVNPFPEFLTFLLDEFEVSDLKIFYEDIDWETPDDRYSHSEKFYYVSSFLDKIPLEDNGDVKPDIIKKIVELGPRNWFLYLLDSEKLFELYYEQNPLEDLLSNEDLLSYFSEVETGTKDRKSETPYRPDFEDWVRTYFRGPLEDPYGHLLREYGCLKKLYSDKLYRESMIK